MQLSTLLDVICAAHLTRYVESPFHSRGGILLVSPPGQLKTTVLSVLELYPDAQLLSDLNNQGLAGLREPIAGGSIQTLAFSDLQKLYERHPTVAQNLEGNLRALVDEGYRQASWEDSRVNKLKARCLCIGAVTESFVAQHFTSWDKTGFLRRFLFCLYRLRDPDILAEAIEKWRLIELEGKAGLGISPPANKCIPMLLTERERTTIRGFLKYQYGNSVPFALVCKIGAVLQWQGTRMNFPRGYHMDMLKEFSECLSKEGAEIIVVEKKGEKQNAKRNRQIRTGRQGKPTQRLDRDRPREKTGKRSDSGRAGKPR